ncbi:Fe-S cluster assembly protein SufD [Legionella qingyii]|uniref:Fe-S cluster assembly protein SufD n=1 Tax=Legionella qingyii TaxID=2184757 RepID=A0A317UAJ9_9GAMM|nr:Fe-S cluster assembly protein SufD [Legionella qingyii]PWY57572.1 Fe-S cluster assembly protein SufD [Legionella qingyii]RUR25960.1 Fe-S cluster assembly protein SufD [Legionella qingyii]RUR29349.1 Fe-S cluster assembly protein SufD [Legionella qingyii]
MSEILDFYQQRAKASLSTLPWLAQLQTKALRDLNRHGFPTRHDEDWKYTSVDALLNQSFMCSGDGPQESAITAHDGKINSDLPVNQPISIRNGLIFGIEQLTSTLPKGVLVLPLSVALSKHPELLQPYLGTILKQEHGFHYLNTAMIQCGLLIYIPAGVVIEEPIALTHIQTQTNQAVYLRHLIIAEAKAQATIIEDYQGWADCCYLTNTVTEIVVGADAKLTHYTIQRESKSAFHLGHLSVRQLVGSEFANHSLSLGGQWVRSDISLYLQEEKSHSLMNGIYAPGEGQHVDHHTTVQHLVPNCTSEQDYKGILTGRSRAVFNGKVFVAKDAQHTDAKQQNKNLLLSANAEVDTKPQLEIFADDVLCSHGATVGQLDEDALFYLATRGIDRLEASHYLIHAFASDNLRLIPHRQLADYMGHLLTQQLG